jgi:ATP-binding cassette subfamily C protein LapB
MQPPILLLDEPSNAMDNRSEEQFKARLAEQLDGRTLLLITHRASLLSLVNRVIVIEAGRVAADGPRDHVLAALAGGKIGAASR